MTTLQAPAKLTWYLEITGTRENGYHELRSEMVTLELHDELIVEKNEDYLRLATHSIEVPLDSTNLITRALQLVGRKAGVTLLKRIPLGGGLGGGSADAGAILRWAGGVTDEFALTLGGDVPFCQLGGRALVEGVGEKLTPLGYEERVVTLFLPSFGVNTADCYAVYDMLVEDGNRPNGRNHLEPAARVVEPRLGSSLDWLRSEFGPGVTLAGSGSTMFVEGHVLSGMQQMDVQGPDGTMQCIETVTSPR